MGKLEIEFSREAAKQYRKLPKEYKSLVEVALNRLAEGLETDLMSIEGERNVFRIRVGKYRLLFVKFARSVLVFKISPRGDVYKR